MGREFIDLFDEWAESYDKTVDGYDIEYRDVFKYYEDILESIALKSNGNILEFGVGTGNLTEKLLEKGLIVTGVEPSQSMRDKAYEKLGFHINLVDGDFLDFPIPNNINTIVSSYAFHHLTDAEKTNAIILYGKLLNTGGKIVFADTMYESSEDYQHAIRNAEAAEFYNLANDLRTEYYTTIPFFKSVFESNGFKVHFERCNDFVWVMEAEKL